MEETRIEEEQGKNGKIVNKIIFSFKELNPSYQRLFMRKAQRESVERMLALQGEERILKAISFITRFRAEIYCPVITTPTQLEEKWGALEMFAVKKRSTKAKNKLIV